MKPRRLLHLLAAVLLAAGPAAANDGTMALGGQGEIYRIMAGRHGDLLPGSAASEADNPALVLERTAPGAAATRLLVPGTEGPAAERFPSLTVDPRTNSVFVVWEARETIHSSLHLTAYSADGWSSVFELSGDEFSIKLNPRLAVTTDSYRTLDGAGEAVERTRVVLHLVWFDSGGPGDRPLYTPLAIEDGVFVSDWRVIDLQEFLEQSSAGSGAAALPKAVHESPVVETSRDGAAALIAFASPLSGRLASVESRPVSAGLISWSDEARHQIIDTGRNLVDRRAIVDKARHQIIDTGRRLLSHDAVDFLTAKFLEEIAASDPLEELQSVVDKARHQIIDTGARLDRSGTRVRSLKAGHSTIVLGETADAGRTPHMGVLEVAASWEAPWLPDHPVRLVPSGDGDDLAVAWDVEGAVKYRVSQGSGWSEEHTLAIGAELSRDRAYELIESRLRRR
jgi:hypothetical protein